MDRLGFGKRDGRSEIGERLEKTGAFQMGAYIVSIAPQSGGKWHISYSAISGHDENEGIADSLDDAFQGLEEKTGVSVPDVIKEKLRS